MKPYKLHDRSSEAWKAFLKSKEPKSEHALQCQIVQFCNSPIGKPIVRGRFASIPNGAYLAGNIGQRAHQAGKLKAEGMRPGMPDMIFWTRLFQAKVLWIEVKKGKTGRVSPEQKAVHAELIECGFRVEIVRTIEEAQRVILEFYGAVAIDLG